jgi:hypothetical protein
VDDLAWSFERVGQISGREVLQQLEVQRVRLSPPDPVMVVRRPLLVSPRGRIESCEMVFDLRDRFPSDIVRSWPGGDLQALIDAQPARPVPLDVGQLRRVLGLPAASETVEDAFELYRHLGRGPRVPRPPRFRLPEEFSVSDSSPERLAGVLGLPVVPFASVMEDRIRGALGVDRVVLGWGDPRRSADDSRLQYQFSVWTSRLPAGVGDLTLGSVRAAFDRLYLRSRGELIRSVQLELNALMPRGRGGYFVPRCDVVAVSTRRVRLEVRRWRNRVRAFEHDRACRREFLSWPAVRRSEFRWFCVAMLEIRESEHRLTFCAGYWASEGCTFEDVAELLDSMESSDLC